MVIKVKCPHCDKEIEIALPDDTRRKLIDVLYGGMSIPDFVKWVKEKLVIKKEKG